MYAIMVISPLVIYWIIIIITWFVKIRHIENALKRRVIFILLLSFPFLDHIITYSFYKTLCYFNGEIKVYKTFSDIETQKINWFNPNRYGNTGIPNLDRYDVIDGEYPNMTSIYVNECKIKKRCEFVDKKIKEKNLYPVFRREQIDELDKKDPIAYMEHQPLIRNALILKNGKLELAYTTACKWVKKYKCEEVDKIVRKYNLKNVIYTSLKNIRTKRTGGKIFFNIRSGKDVIYNRITKEVYAEKQSYGFTGGWYYHVAANRVVSLARCYNYNIINLKEQVVPNPFKRKDK